MTYIPGYSSPRPWQRLNRLDKALLLGGGVFCLWFIWRAAVVMDHQWNWEGLFPYIFYKNATGNWQPGVLLGGLAFTLRLGVWSLLLALISGSLVGVLSAHQRGISALPATLYINVMRNTPPLVLLFLVFFFAGSFLYEPVFQVEAAIAKAPSWLRTLVATLVAPPGQLDRMAAAVLTLGLYEGAYVAEIVRAGIESVPKAQYEAAASQGMTKWQQYCYVISPQALRLMLPPLVGQAISTFKETTLASIISLPELTFQSLEVMAVTRMTFELWIATAALYLAISYAWVLFAAWLEKRQTWHPLQ